MFNLESRTIEQVQNSTRFLLKSFQAKVAELKLCGADINQVLRFGIDYDAACSTAKEFFGSDRVEYIAIDGTESIDQRLDMLVFYVGAFGYSGNVTFLENEVVIDEPRSMKGELSISTAVPLSEEDAAEVFGQKTESGLEIDVNRLPGALMHLAEYYLAYKAAVTDNPAKIILLDRTLAGDVGHHSWSTRELVQHHLSILEGMETPHGVVENFDLQLCRILLPNDNLKIPAPRSHLLKYAAIAHILDGKQRSIGQLITELGASHNHMERLRTHFGELENESNIFGQVFNYKLKDKVSKYWDRVLAAAVAVADHVFDPRGQHPLRFRKKAEEYWITADDIDFITLILVYALTRRAWTTNLLLIGLIKDTGARELVKTVIPLLKMSGKLKLEHSFPHFDSDKMLLQTNSVVNAENTPTPWHSVETDAAFKTMSPVEDASMPKGKARVRGSFKNVIYPERSYVKTYIQLWSSKKNPGVRSHVFSYDRPAYPTYDHWDEILLYNMDSKVDEKISPIIHFDRGSEMTNLSMAILHMMSKEVVPEAIGHNYPLFLADKKAKTILSQHRQAYLGAVALEMSRSDLDQEVLFSNRFRDYRAKIEAQRKK